MAAASLSASSALFISSSSSKPPLTSFSPAQRLTFPHHSPALSASSYSVSPSPITFSPRRLSASASFSVRASAEEKKKVLIVNTNSGGHAIIGFYFAKELLASGHQVTVLTVGDEGSDKMKKPPFSRFSEIVSGGGRTVWGDPADVGKVLAGESFDVVLDNNGKDLDAVK